MSSIYPYAGFWRRLGALIIDAVIISIPTTMLTVPVMFSKIQQLAVQMPADGSPSPEMIQGLISVYGSMFALQLVGLVIFWLYFSIMESSKLQATLGKMALGIKVTDEKGNRISFGRATGRTLGKLISYMIMYIGFLMAGFTARKQALHDFMASTLVVEKTYQPGEPLPEGKSHITALVLTIIGLAALCILPFILLFVAVMHLPDAPASSRTAPAAVSDTFQKDMQETEKSMDATLQLMELSQEASGDREPVVTEDFTYYFNTDGARAVRKADESYTVYLPKGQYMTCCEKGKCGAVLPACK